MLRFVSAFLTCSWLILACKSPGNYTLQEAANAGSAGLAIEGNRLVDARGSQVVLRGVSFHDLAMFPVSEGMLDFVVKTGANVVRVPFYVGGDKLGTSYEDYMSKFHAVAAYALAKGLYVVLDFHAIADAKRQDLADLAKRFFSDVIKTYGPSGKVLYEIFNEPKDSSWADIKAYANSLIAHIRDAEKQAQIGQPGVIIVGTPNWSSDIAAAAADPLTDPNLMYTFHFYALNHQFKEEFESIADKLPLFVSEWAPFHASEINNSAINKENLEKLVGWMERKKISWTCWSFSDEGGMYRWFKSGTLSGVATADKLEPWGRLGIRLLKAPTPEGPGPMPRGDKTIVLERDNPVTANIATFAKELANPGSMGSLEELDRPNAPASSEVSAPTGDDKSGAASPAPAPKASASPAIVSNPSTTSGEGGVPSPASTDVGCAGYNRDGVSCSHMGIKTGELSCAAGDTWRCVNGCAQWVKSGCQEGSSPGGSGQDCRSYNQDGHTCAKLGFSDGEERCHWGQRWRCVSGCALWLSSC